MPRPKKSASGSSRAAANGRKANSSPKTGSPKTISRKTVSPNPGPPAPWFREAGLTFLRGLERNNRRDWFDPRKPEFERELKQPMIALIEAVTEAMNDFAPGHVRPAQKSMMRIYRDTRFSADKRPYKNRVAAWWSCAGLEKTSGAGFYVHVSAKEVVIAAGAYMPERDQLFAIRTFLLDHHAEVRRLLEDKRLRRVMDSFSGMPLTRPPKGFPKEHPAMDLLLCRQWGLEATLSSKAALKKDFVREVISRFRLAAPLVEALNRPLLHKLEKKRRPLFGLIR
jgi:uncharacterized protein (TIGR02453 family)